MRDTHNRQPKKMRVAQIFLLGGGLTGMRNTHITAAMNLAAWRKRESLSQLALALALGVSQSTVARYEKGEHIPPARVMPRIRELTNDEVTANDFYPERESAAG